MYLRYSSGKWVTQLWLKNVRVAQFWRLWLRWQAAWPNSDSTQLSKIYSQLNSDSTHLSQRWVKFDSESWVEHSLGATDRKCILNEQRTFYTIIYRVSHNWCHTLAQFYFTRIQSVWGGFHPDLQPGSPWGSDSHVTSRPPRLWPIRGCI